MVMTRLRSLVILPPSDYLEPHSLDDYPRTVIRIRSQQWHGTTDVTTTHRTTNRWDLVRRYLTMQTILILLQAHFGRRFRKRNILRTRDMHDFTGTITCMFAVTTAFLAGAEIWG